MTRSQLSPQIDSILLSNLVGAISAENHRLLIHAIVDWALGSDDLVSTLGSNGGSQLLPFSQAGASLLNDNLRQYVATAVAQVKADILGGAGPAYDTLQELAALEITDQAVLAGVLTRLAVLEAGSYVRPDGTVAFTAPQTGLPGTLASHLATVAQVEAGGPVFSVLTAVNVAQVGTLTPMGSTRVAEPGQPARVFVPSECYVSLRSKGAGTLTTAGTLVIGTNAPDYNNIATVPLANALTVGLNVQQVLNSQSIPAGTAIYCKVLTAQLGTAATTYVPILRGFYTVLPS